MKNIVAHITRIEKNLQSLSQQIPQKIPEFIASALYLASSHDQDSVFALAHAGGDQDHIARADKHVWHRRLRPEDSIAAAAFQSHKPSLFKSRMFPDEHLCGHFPIHAASGAKGILQLVFQAHASIDLNGSVLRDIKDRTLSRIEKPLSKLIAQNNNLDEDLNVRAPYAPDAVIMFFDISSFTDASLSAAYRAQDFADKFCKDFILDTARPYNAQLLRMEGDGVWLALPFSPQSIHEKQRAAKNAVALTHQIATQYKKFAAQTDPQFAQTHIKALAEMGEIRTLPWTPDQSGPVFITMTDNLSAMRRDQNHAMTGPELTQLITPPHVHHQGTQRGFSDLSL